MATIYSETPEQPGKQATSANGKPYQTDSDEAPADGGDANITSSFNIEVNWPVTGDHWTETAQYVKDTANITRYKLIDQGWPPTPPGPPPFYSQYVLWFTNERHWNYSFTDKEGDTYGCNTFINRDHNVAYNSTNPTIVRIYGN